MALRLRSRKRIGPTGRIVFGLVFAAVGIGIAIVGVNMLAKANASSAWPSVKGKIVASDVKKSTSSRKRSKGRRKSTKYRAIIKYEYTVAETKHTGNQVSFGGSSTSMSAAKAVASRYPKGADVDVYYDPENPDEAVLETGTSASTYIPLGVGLVFGLIGMFLAGQAFLAKKKSSVADPSIGDTMTAPDETYAPPIAGATSLSCGDDV
ncbi:MAG: DUF3592 domain-containing protein [Phycisphaerales bacterium]|nr:DUF3592 domain-containing protein [Phycisphaerales bacterium]